MNWNMAEIWLQYWKINRWGHWKSKFFFFQSASTWRMHFSIFTFQWKKIKKTHTQNYKHSDHYKNIYSKLPHYYCQHYFIVSELMSIDSFSLSLLLFLICFTFPKVSVSGCQLNLKEDWCCQYHSKSPCSDNPQVVEVKLGWEGLYLSPKCIWVRKLLQHTWCEPHDDSFGYWGWNL